MACDRGHTHLIVFMHACGYYLRAATNQGAASIRINMVAHHHAHYTLYNRTYFAGLIFMDSRLSAKTAKIGPLENFPLYGMHEMELQLLIVENDVFPSKQLALPFVPQA